MKKYILSLSLFAGLLATSGSALADVYYDYAKVTKVRPVYEYVTVGRPHEVCYPVKYRSHRHNPGATVMGAIIGGAIGNAIGDNGASTAAGAIIGGSIGHEAGGYGRTVVRERCEVSHEGYRKEKRLKGYKVKYRYKGERYHTFMHQRPGKKIKVRVKVSPAYYD